eukprot:SAG31_NODE_39322_length_289_cov_0.810526_1_plen_21_part_01
MSVQVRPFQPHSHSHMALNNL